MQALAAIAALYGFLYPVVVGAALGAGAGANRAFRPRPAHWVPLLIPAAAYYVLEYLVSARQGWNMPYAVLVLSGFGALTVLAACIARRPSWLRAGAAAGVALAIALWRLVPDKPGHWNRLF